MKTTFTGKDNNIYILDTETNQAYNLQGEQVDYEKVMTKSKAVSKYTGEWSHIQDSIEFNDTILFYDVALFVIEDKEILKEFCFGIDSQDQPYIIADGNDQELPKITSGMNTKLLAYITSSRDNDITDYMQLMNYESIGDNIYMNKSTLINLMGDYPTIKDLSEGKEAKPKKKSLKELLAERD